MLYIELEDNEVKGTVEVYDPLEKGIIKMEEGVKDQLVDTISTVFSKLRNLVDNGKNKNSEHLEQQFDFTSCGVITAENGNNVIDGEHDRFKTSCDTGADVELRKKHTKAVNCEAFQLVLDEQKLDKNEMNDEVYKSKVAQVVLAWQRIDDDKKLSIRKSIKEQNNAVVIAQSIRDIFREHEKYFKKIEIEVNKFNLYDVLFLETQGELKFQDGTVDIY